MKTDKKILMAFLLNLSFSIIEFVGGLITNSVAIISDSVHDMGDAISIGISCFLERKSMKKPDNKYTYGYVRYSVLGSLIMVIILLVGSILIIYNSITRLFNPVEINYNGMIIFAILGILINFLAVYFTSSGNSLNQKSVNLHMIEDVLGWIVVLFGAIIMKFTNILLIDSILSICVACFILINARKNLGEIVDLFLEKTPNNINIEDIKKHLLEIKGVVDIHHIHVRSIDGFNNYATMHVVVKKYDEDIKKDIKRELEEHDISHSTIELEELGEICLFKECKIEKNKKIDHHSHH